MSFALNQSRQPTPGVRLAANRASVARRGCALRSVDSSQDTFQLAVGAVLADPPDQRDGAVEVAFNVVPIGFPFVDAAFAGHPPNQALHAMSAAPGRGRFGSLLGGTHA